MITSLKNNNCNQIKKFNFVDYKIGDVGKAVSEETELGRLYSIDGKNYPSITTIMSWYKKPVIDKWKKNVGADLSSKILKRTSDRGTKLHSICENYISNKSIDEEFELLPKNIQKMFMSIKKYIDQYVDNVYCQEKSLYSTYLRTAGKVDCVAEFDGKKSVIDFKTSDRRKTKAMIDSYFMQAACYAVMFEELTGIGIPRIVVIIANENDKPSIFVEKRDAYIYQFIKVRHLYDDYLKKIS